MININIKLSTLQQPRSHIKIHMFYKAHIKETKFHVRLTSMFLKQFLIPDMQLI